MEKKFNSLDDHYDLKMVESDSFDADDEVVNALARYGIDIDSLTAKQIKVTSKAKGPPRTINYNGKEEMKTPGTDPLLEAFIFPDENLIIVEKMFKFLDATAKNEMLPIFEILFQCAGKSGMRPPGPRLILSDDVINDVTESFI